MESVMSQGMSMRSTLGCIVLAATEVAKMKKLRHRQLASCQSVFPEESSDHDLMDMFWAQQEETMLIVTTIIASMLALLKSACEQNALARRVIPRAIGKWRGSTVAGYLFRGDEASYLLNFRMSRESFQMLHHMLMLSPITANIGNLAEIRRERREAVWDVELRSEWCRRTDYGRAMTDPPETEFKIATCLYVFAHGGPLKVLADAASIGVSTLRRWLYQFCESIIKCVRPHYMPATPFTKEEMLEVRANFAARRGIDNVILAADGTHVPFHPTCKAYANDYLNFKGWHSILAVAYVDSFYRFFDVDVGAAGRAGDNTVLRHNWLLKAMVADPDKWLGPNGIVLGDCGASDADNFFLNPYHAPHTPEQSWFNFCHSSTRFFVEETFGRWKNRWRFLLRPIHTNHKLTTLMIYTSGILHNFCTANAKDTLPHLDDNTPVWSTFYKKYTAHRCFTCKQRGVAHCLHQAAFRNGAAQTFRARSAPSVMRDDLRNMLWEKLTHGMAMGTGTPMDNDDVLLAQASGVNWKNVQHTIGEMQERASGHWRDRA